ncbi:MAG: CHAD domain-containing protein [Caldilineales bacterium]
MPATLFRAAEPLDQTALAGVLDGAFAVVEDEAAAADTVYLDTFDWRLFSRSSALLLSGNVLTLTPLDGDGESIETAVEGQPVFAWDLPAGRLRRQVESALEMRALLARAQVRTLTTVYRVLNEDEKTVSRLAVDALHLTAAAHDEVQTFLRLMPVRGYDRELAVVAEHLADGGATELAPGELYRAVMLAAGEQPGGYQPKPVVPLDPTVRADEAMKALLRAELEVIQINEPYIPQDIDTEFLHDYRVALRRARSALAEVKGVFRADITRKLRADLQFANRFSNDLRDLDVYLLSEERYRALLPGQLRAGITPLFDHLRARRAAALTALVEALESPAYRRAIAGFAAFLEKPVPRNTSAPNGAKPVLQVANQRITKQYRQVLRDGAAITAESPDEMLHALRIECKKLRYLMELFSGLYAPREINRLIRQLRTLQGNLGDFNDLSVQEAYLMRTADEMAARRLPSPDTLMAIGALVAALDAERAVVRGVC